MKFVFLPLLLVAAAHAEVSLHPLFTDGVVLQRDTPVPVWGAASREGEPVSVSLGDLTVSTVAKGGRWRVDLPAMPADATPRPLTVKGDNTLTVNDTLVGEVWVCSGQSNMEWTLRMLKRDAEASGEDTGLRVFTVARATAASPSDKVSGKWRHTTPAEAVNFSAVAYHFGKTLRARLGVPVGLIVTAWGGTRVEAWMSPEALAAIPAGEEFVKADTAAAERRRVAAQTFERDKEKLLAEWENQAAKAKAEGRKAPPKPAAPGGGADGEQNRPSRLRHAMLTPILPYAMRGVIWYQGESNNRNAADYRDLFPAMIADWRKAWGRGEFPFLFVQIAPHREMTPELREAQFLTLSKSPKTAMAVITDAGDANNIHPARKQPVGERLALAARALAYGEALEYSGPLFAGADFANGKAVVRFTHWGTGLATADGAEPRGFTLAGADGRFSPAHAVISGETLTVSSPDVPAPVAVRYGWSNTPDVNLTNREGLPASPFRSDVR